MTTARIIYHDAVRCADIGFSMLPLLTLVAVLAIPPGGSPTLYAAEEVALLDALIPDEVVSLSSFWQQLSDIDNRPWDSFKLKAIQELASHIATYINSAPNGDIDAAVRTLRDKGFRTCLQGMYGARLKDLQKSAAQLRTGAIDSAAASADQKATKVTLNVDGTVNVPLPESLAEVLWLLGPVEPFVSDSAATWTADLKKLSIDERQEWIARKIVDSIHDYAYFRRRVAKLQLFLDQPPWVHQLIEKVSDGQVQAKPIQELLTRLEGTGELTALIGSISEATSETELVRIQKQVEELRRQTHRARVELSPALVKYSTALKSLFDRQTSALQRLDRYYRSLYSQKHIDFPLGRKADDPAPFLRFHITPPDNRNCRGLMSRVDVRVSVCRWIGDRTVVTNTTDANASVKFDRQLGLDALTEPSGSLLPVEDIPLGLSITEILFRDGGSMQLPDGLTPKVSVNQHEMRLALRRMGLPEQIILEGISVQVLSLTNFIVRADVTAPAFASSLTADLSPEKMPIEIHIDLENLGAGLVEDVLVKTVDALQSAFEDSIRRKLTAPTNTANLQMVQIESLGQWRNGNICYQIGLKTKRIGEWTLPDEAGMWTVRASCQKESDRWRIRLSPAAPPNALISFLRERLIQHVKSTSLDETKLGQNVAELAKYIRLDQYNYDPNLQTISAVLLFGPELLPADSPIRIPPAQFTINLKTGDLDLNVFSDFNKQLEAAAQIMLAEFLKRINGELSERAAELLKGRKLEFFGGTLTVIGTPVHDRGRIRFNVTGEALGKKIEATNVLLTGGKITETGVESPKFDFRETTFGPDLGKLIPELLDLDASIVRIGPVVRLPDAISFPVSIRIEELGGDIPLGQISLGDQGVKANPLEALKSKLPDLVERFVVEKLAGQAVIDDLGPISQLALDKDKTHFLHKLEVWVKGKAEVPGLNNTFLPFSARILPGPPEVHIDEGDAAAEAALTALKQILPESFLAASPIKNPEPIRSKPYGVSFDLEIKAWVFTVAAKGVRLTTRGMELPASIAVQPPGMIPVPTAFAIVDPGVVVPLKRDGEIGVVGDVTLGSKGIDKIVKFRSVLTTSTRHPGTFKLDGTLILVDMLPLLKVDGTAAFDTGVLDLNAQTVGFVDKIIQVRDRTHVEAAKGLFEQNGSLGVLGIRLTQTNIKIEAFRPALSANAQAVMPLVTAQLAVTASPRLSDFQAHANFDVALGRFSLSSGVLDVDASKVDFRFHVVLFDVRVIAPSITTLTPDRVIHAILSLFDFDISAFFDAIINRKITISFFDDSGKSTNGSVGQGNPPPADSRGAPSDSIPPGSSNRSATEAGGKEQPTESGEIAGTNLPPKGPSETQTSPDSSRPGEKPTRREPIENLVRTRQKGDTTYEIVKDPDGSGLFVEKFTWDGKPYFGWMLLSQDVRDHLLAERPEDGGKVMVLSWLWRPLTEVERGKVVSRAKQPVIWVSGYLTLNAHNQVHVCGRFPDGKVELVELPFDQIGPKPGARTPDETYELFRNYDADSAAKKFTDGDIAVLTNFARSRFVLNFGGTKFYKRLPAASTGRKLGDSEVMRPEGYLYEVTDENARKELVFQPREGSPLILESSDPLYEHLELSDAAAIDSSKRTANVIALLTHTSSLNLSAGYIFGGTSGPMLFAISTTTDSQQRELWTVTGDGAFAQPLSLLNDSLKHDDRTSIYFTDLDGTSGFAKALADEAVGGLWTECQIREYDLGVDRGQFLTSFSAFTREAHDADLSVKQTEKWLADAKVKSDGANVTLYTTELKDHTSKLDDLRGRLGAIESQRRLRAAFSKGAAQNNGAKEADPNWEFALVFRKPNGETSRYPASGAFKGADVASAYATWLTTGLIIDPPHTSLDTIAARQWLIDEMLRPERSWTVRWKADPVTLLRNAKQ